MDDKFRVDVRATYAAISTSKLERLWRRIRTRATATLARVAAGLLCGRQRAVKQPTN